MNAIIIGVGLLLLFIIIIIFKDIRNNPGVYGGR